MKRTTKMILEHKMIVILRGIEKEKIIPVAEAMYEGGVRLIEITYSADGKVSDEETAEYIKILTQHFEDKMEIGAGTVLSTKQAILTKQAGGKFIISPDANTEVIRKTKQLDMVSVPGAYTPTEIQAAHIAGADFVKLFPVVALGSDYVKAVKAPLSHIKFLAVGGVGLNNIEEYKKAGVCGFGIGSNIVDKKALEENDYDKITQLAKKYIEIIKK